jgi:hypothetical protein
MFLSKPELKRLRLISVELLNYAKLTQVVSDLGHNIQQYSLEDNLDLVTMEVLKYANNEGWIEQFIIQLRNAYPAVPDLAAFYAEVTTPVPILAAPAAAPGAPVAGPAPARDAFTVVYVDNRPFVDRTKLRGTLRTLAAPGGPRILNIRGEPRSGKTYTQYLINHLGEQIGFEVIPIDLTRYADLSPFEIGRSITSRMGLRAPETPGLEQWSRWTLRFFDDLVGQMRSQPDVKKQHWWIVMDNFKSVSVPEAINDFVDALSLRIDEELLNVRAVLISYERTLPQKVAPIVAVDETTVIGVPELSEFFVRFYSEKKPHFEEVDRTTRAVTKVAEVMAKTTQSGGAGLDFIGAELLDQCRKILAEVP